MLGALCAALEELGPPEYWPAPEDVADALWLASQLSLRKHGDETQPPAQAKPESTPDDSLEAVESAPARGASVPIAPKPDVGGEFPLLPRRVEGITTGAPLRTPAIEALPNRIILSRTLRPLRRTTPSRVRFVLDEEATAKSVADDGLWLPVLRPAPTRGFDIALVLDDGPSMRIWRSTLREVWRLLEREGIARDMRVWRLDTAQQGKVRLLSETGRSERRPREVSDPTGRRLVLVVTDCVSPGWWGRDIPQILSLWGRTQPVSLVQVLPQRLWAQTALSAASIITARSPRAGAAAAALEPLFRRTRRHDAVRSETSPTPVVPVTTLEPEFVQVWARLVAGREGATGPALGLGNLAEARQPEAMSKAPAAVRVSEFRARASPKAFELACILAAAPLRLPVIRLVQRAVLPTAGQVHLAEFFSSGLLWRASNSDDNPEDVLYDFEPGIRDILLSTGRLAQQLHVQREVSKYIADRFGQVFDFDAYIADPDAFAKAPVDSVDVAFATVTAAVLRQLGGAHREAADRFEYGTTTEQVTEPEPISATSGPPLTGQTFSMEKQEQSNWSWCAVALSVAKFFDPTLRISQCELANLTLGRTDCCTTQGPTACNVPYSLGNALAAIGISASASPARVTAAQLIELLDEQKIVPVRIEWSGGGGHFQVITGYSSGLNGGTFLEVHDSAIGVTSHIALDEMLSSREFTLSHIYRIHPISRDVQQDERAVAGDASPGNVPRHVYQQVCRIILDGHQVGNGCLVGPDVVLTVASLFPPDARNVPITCLFDTPDRYTGEISYVDDKLGFTLIRLARLAGYDPVNPVELNGSGAVAATRGWLTLGEELPPPPALRGVSINTKTDVIAWHSATLVSGGSSIPGQFLCEIGPPATFFDFGAAAGSPIFNREWRIVGLLFSATGAAQAPAVEIRGIPVDAVRPYLDRILGTPSTPRVPRGIVRASIRQQIAKELRDQFDLLVAWPPQHQFKLGEVGVIDDGTFNPVSSLEQFGVTFTAYTDADTHLFFSYTSSGVISTRSGEASVAGQRVQIAFPRPYSMYFDAQDCRISRIGDLGSVAEAILSRNSRGEWGRGFVIITEVVTAGSLIILVSGRAGAQATLAKEAAAEHQADAEYTLKSASGIAFTVIGKRGLTPLFRAAGVKRSLWRPPRFEILP